MADVLAVQVIGGDVPAVGAVLEPVGLDPSLGELVLVLLVVVELEDPLLGDRLVDDAGDLGVAALAGDLQTLAEGSWPSAVTIFARALWSPVWGRWSPNRSIAATSAFASSGSSRAGRAKLSP